MGGFGGFGGGGAGLQGMATRADINEGFALNGLENGIRGIQQGLCDGFYAVNTGLLTGFNGIQSQLASCCCETQRSAALATPLTVLPETSSRTRTAACVPFWTS